MTVYIVRIEHHDATLRAQHLDAHIDWLNNMVESGFVRLSGPLSNGPLAGNGFVAAVLVVVAGSTAEVFETMATDPFSQMGVTQSLTITGWNPVFGMLAQHSQGVDSLTGAGGT